MDQLSTAQDEITSTFSLDYSLLELTGQLYGLKRRFETEYYESQALGNLELARNFTIYLNATIFEVNSMLEQPSYSKCDLPISNSEKADIYRHRYKKISVNSHAVLISKIELLKYELQALLDYKNLSKT